MTEYVFTFISEKNKLELSMQGNISKCQMIYQQLYILFSEVDHLNKTIKLNIKHSFNEELLTKVNSFVDSYRKDLPALNKLSGFFKKLKDSELIYVLPYAEKELLYSRLLSQRSLELLNNGLEEEAVYSILEQERKIFDDTFSDLFKDYIIQFTVHDTKVYIGEKVKQERVCRFCGLGMKDGKTFKKTAHAIPEALGNKNIINNEECDDCNETLGRLIEQDLVNYLNLYRSFYNIKGKEKTPTILYKSGKSIGYADDIFTIIDVKENDELVFDSLPQKIQLETREKINKADIYRALCKIALGTIDHEYLLHFESTVKWIMKDKGFENCDSLPRVAVLLNPTILHTHPSIILYIRKTDNCTFPFVVAEFKVLTFVFVYIIPLCSKDETNFVDKEQYNTYWDKFKHYQNYDNWEFDDFSIDKELGYIINITLSENK